MLIDATIRKAGGKDKPYKLADANGLHLYITPSGGKSWRYKYRFGGKERRIVFGSYPDISLRQARDLRDDARQTLRQGRDPGLAAKLARHVRRTGHEKTFEQFARDWHDNQRSKWKDVHARDVITSMERDLFPLIGAFPVADIDEAIMLGVLRKVEERGAIETAHRLRQRAERVFKFAKGAGAPNTNPAASVTDSLKPVPLKRRYPALTDADAIRELIREVDRAGASPITRLASRFMALTAQRPGMCRNLEWTELTGIDWADDHVASPAALWTVPARKVKQELELRDDETFDHPVPLTAAAVEVLQAVRPLTGRSRYVFPNTRTGNKPMSENAVGYLYNREGWKGRHVPHGWRSSFSTIMNGFVERLYPGAERLLIDRLIIDLMLAHRPTGMSATEFRYNRQAYMERRRELAKQWSALILDGAEPVSVACGGARRRRR